MKRLIPFLTVLFLASACDPPVMPLPGITGKAGELVVVMKDSRWKGAAGDTVFNTLTQDVYGLPQPEPMFNVVHIKSSAFTKIFQTHRNIVYVSIGKDLKTSIDLKTDVWATPQVVVEISASSVEEFIDIFGANASKIIGHVLNKEESRIQRSYGVQLNLEVVNGLKDKWGLKVGFPKGYNLVSETEDFSWIRYETKDISQNILIYSLPYTEENTFSKEGMETVVDQLCKMAVPGPDDGTFMSLYPDYPPMYEDASLAGNYAGKLTGLWTIEGALMGGPYVSYAFLDASEKRVYYLQGFVFSPGKKKRNYVRQLDAILKSTQLL